MEIIKIALNSLRVNKLRSTLTILGIIVGIFSIIATSTIITIMQNSIEEGISQLGQNTFQIQKWPAMVGHGPGGRDRTRNRKDIKLEDYERLKDLLTDAQAVGAELWQYGKTFQYGNKETNPNIQLSGATTEAFPNNKWIAESGRIFNEKDIDRYERVVVLGAEVATTLFGNSDPIGKEVKVDNRNLRVIGVLEKQGSFFGQSQDNFAVSPITTFQSFYGKDNRSINITVTSKSKEDYQDLMDKATGFMRTIRKVPPGEEDDFGIYSNESILTQINDITASVRIGAIVISLIALTAAGVGIMNIMLVSVTERTREIGIRKAVGARKSNILVQFLTEAVVLCQLGGIIGIVLGILVGNILGSMLEASNAIPYDWVIIGIMLCVFVGVGFGTYPAYKAANLDPIEALRYE
ncbi:MAG: FtsX-like permease family protein [Ignavibacteria bacterium]|nr:FtsX-like permease family protein [Ignavibacteria bacterium]